MVWLNLSAQQKTCRPFGGGFFMGGSGREPVNRVGVGVGSGRCLAGVPATGRPDGYVPISLEGPPPGARLAPPSNVDRLRRRRHNLGENNFRFNAFYCGQCAMYHGNF